MNKYLVRTIVLLGVALALILYSRIEYRNLLSVTLTYPVYLAVIISFVQFITHNG